MKSVYTLTKDEFLTKYNSIAKPFHYDCLEKWLSVGAKNFEDMTNLPKALIEAVKEEYRYPLLTKVLKINKESDSIKLLLELEDKEKIECVLLENNKNEYTACVSSEVGCSMKCEFCATGTLGLKRQLRWYEIVEQFFKLKDINGKINRIVFMGMGEPLCNTNEVLKAISYIKEKIGFSDRRITVSTSGIPSGIKKLADSKIGVKLAVSLVSANDKIRSSLMKTNRLYPLTELKKALLYFREHSRSRIALEYCMLKGINTSGESAKELKEFTKGLIVSVNLIPWNTLDNLPFQKPDKKEIEHFQKELSILDIPFTTRISRGQSTNAACGMLALKDNNK